MIQICQKDKEKVFEAIRTGKIDAAEMSFPNLIDDILLVMKKRGLTASLVLSELWVLLEKADVKISAFSFILFILIFGYLW